MLLVSTVLLYLFYLNKATKLELFNNDSSTSIYEVNTPPWSLGSLNFPVTGIAGFGKGCNAISQISESPIVKSWNSSLPKLIAIVDYDLGGCFQTRLIFECQKRDWCGSIFFRDGFFDPTGIEMWILYEKHRSRSEYKVPMVQVKSDDFSLFKKLILDSEKNNQTYQLTLTHDPNPWVPMFHSVIYLVILRILTPIWSLGCLIFIIKILWNQYIRKKNASRSRVKYQSKCSKKLLEFKPTMKQICLHFHTLSHISRIAFSVDPFQCQQIYTYPITIFLVSGSIAFEIATIILLSFLIRELTQSTQSLNSLKKVNIVYFFVVIFIVGDFYTTAIEAFQLEKSKIPSFIILVMFYAVVSAILGSWYLVQAYQFLKKCSEYEKVVKRQNRKRIALTQISIMNSVGLLLLSFNLLLFGISEIFGKPWGYFSLYSLFMANIQITSFLQIMLFGGVVIDFSKLHTVLSRVAQTE